ncbi:hypothetical protein [Methylophilus sp. 14]|uniref:hypothetical protein n=1 Tax=Methylophilus sp. 14 TaxID=2781019 RepID=UPI00188F930A|nr:hypothetical protein [Methylophilus sp. 14]MBF4988083.1 hypothetical protein [Methylophilus sp. 14]
MDSNKRQNTQAFSAFFRSFANSCYIAFCIVAIVTSLQIEMNQLAASARQGVIMGDRGVCIMTNNVAKHQS